jgi:hypothetical protein
MGAKCNNSVSSLCWCAWVSVGLVLLSGFATCSRGGEYVGTNSSIATPVKPQKLDWEKFINECISKVEKSEAVFYRRGERVSGKEVAQQMREYLRHILRNKTVPDPFGRNVGIVLAMITTHEGIYRDGLTGSPEPIVIEVGGKRVKVYDWLKQELGVNSMPGEEEGHEALETLYETELTPDLLAQWERYIDNCIKVVREASGVTFSLKEKVSSPAEVAVVMENNRTNAIRLLTSPEIKDRNDKKRYRPGWVLVRLTSVPQPMRESFPDQAKFNKAIEVWATGDNEVVGSDGRRNLLTMWLESKAGEPPPMPKLKGKSERVLEK